MRLSENGKMNSVPSGTTSMVASGFNRGEFENEDGKWEDERVRK
jgi:hypothetical protein